MKSVHTTSPDISVMKNMFETFVRISEPFSPDLNLNIIHEFIPTSAISRVATDATAYAHRDPTVTVLAFGMWAEDTLERTAFAKDATSQLLKMTTDAEKIIDEKDNVGYGNYCAFANGYFAAFGAVILMSSLLGFTDVDGGSVSETLQKAKALFGNNYPRLQQIKSKHDPELLFSKWFPIIPAVEA